MTHKNGVTIPLSIEITRPKAVQLSMNNVNDRSGLTDIVGVTQANAESQSKHSAFSPSFLSH